MLGEEHSTGEAAATSLDLLALTVTNVVRPLLVCCSCRSCRSCCAVCCWPGAAASRHRQPVLAAQPARAAIMSRRAAPDPQRFPCRAPCPTLFLVLSLLPQLNDPHVVSTISQVLLADPSFRQLMMVRRGYTDGLWAAACPG